MQSVVTTLLHPPKPPPPPWRSATTGKNTDKKNTSSVADYVKLRQGSPHDTANQRMKQPKTPYSSVASLLNNSLSSPSSLSRLFGKRGERLVSQLQQPQQKVPLQQVSDSSLSEAFRPRTSLAIIAQIWHILGLSVQSLVAYFGLMDVLSFIAHDAKRLGLYPVMPIGSLLATSFVLSSAYFVNIPPFLAAVLYGLIFISVVAFLWFSAEKQQLPSGLSQGLRTRADEVSYGDNISSPSVASSVDTASCASNHSSSVQLGVVRKSPIGSKCCLMSTGSTRRGLSRMLSFGSGSACNDSSPQLKPPFSQPDLSYCGRVSSEDGSMSFKEQIFHHQPMNTIHDNENISSNNYNKPKTIIDANGPAKSGLLTQTPQNPMVVLNEKEPTIHKHRRMLWVGWISSGPVQNISSFLFGHGHHGSVPSRRHSATSNIGIPFKRERSSSTTTLKGHSLSFSPEYTLSTKEQHSESDTNPGSLSSSSSSSMTNAMSNPSHHALKKGPLVSSNYINSSNSNVELHGEWTDSLMRCWPFSIVRSMIKSPAKKTLLQH